LRVTSRKSAYLIFTVTVRPQTRVFSHQAQTSSAIASTPASTSTGSVRSSAKVLSDPEDLRGRSGTIGRLSSPLAMAGYQVPDLLKGRCRIANDCRLRSAPVKMPSRFILSAVTGPTPWNLPIGKVSTNAAAIAGGTMNWLLGLQWSEASLARNLLYEMPADAVRPVSSKMRGRISAAVPDAVEVPRRFSVTSR